jgi:diadenylate cyclase
MSLFWWITPLDVLDVAVTAVFIYYILLLIRGTRAVQILLGLLVLLAMLGAATLLHLLVLATVLQVVLLGTAVALPIVFQPELRRALEQLGRGGLLVRRESSEGSAARNAALAIVARAAVALARERVGALIAIQQTTGLREFVESGTKLDAKVTLDLLLTIFARNTPLHDGAVIIHNAEIEAAGCFLPLSETVRSESHMGTRHRAALGLSEQTDAVVVIVSEETGSISIAQSGRLSRALDDEARLRNVLVALCETSRIPRPGRKARRSGDAQAQPPGWVQPRA